MDQKITDLDIAISMSASDLIPIVDANGNNKVLHGSQVKDYVADAVVSDIDDVKAMISDEYDPERVTPYEAGDLVIYNNTLYKCLDTTSGAWDSTKWDDTTIEAEISLKQDSTDNTLSTTDKTVVGAINELVPSITNISTISDTVNSGVDNDIYSVSLNKGIYIFNGFTLWKTSGTAQGLTMIALLGTDTITQNLEYTVGWCVENLTAIFKVTNDNTTFKIRLYQTTGSNVNVDFSGNITRILNG